MNQHAADTELNNELPSCGVKQNPVISFPLRIFKEGTDTTDWFNIRPK